VAEPTTETSSPPSAPAVDGPAAASQAAPSPARGRLTAHVASHTPGRLRLRVPAAAREPAAMQALHAHLTATLGPGHAQVNPTTGSVLVHYDRQTHSSADIARMVEDVCTMVGESVRDIGLEAPEEGSGSSSTSVRIVDAMTDLDRQLSLLTGRKIDLKLLFPLALGGIGLWRAARSGLGITEVPAYVLLWYAFDSFWKFHREPAQRTLPAADAQAAPAPNGRAES